MMNLLILNYQHGQSLPSPKLSHYINSTETEVQVGTIRIKLVVSLLPFITGATFVPTNT